ncbi:mechanosensitive ion channel family protein [bacterium]|nr:mechanosensitive ion channel family protein [bacterium]
MTVGFLESGLLDHLLRWYGPQSPLRGVIIAVAVLVILVYLHRTSRERLRLYMKARAQRERNVKNFLRTYDTVWKVMIGLVVLVAAAGSFSLLGLTMGFFGTMLGWSLQTPIRGVAAWAMVVLGKPFRIGDRINVGGVTGDVVDIQLNHIVLNQVGGTVSGEERSGRGIYVPTAILFGEQVINYSLFGHEQELSTETSGFMLDEVPVRLTLGSDYEFAKTLCIDAARQAVAELVGDTGEAPFTRVEFLPSGILLRVRYKTAPAQRQEVSSRVTELIWQAVLQHPQRVQFRAPVARQTITFAPGTVVPPAFRQPEPC